MHPVHNFTLCEGDWGMETLFSFNWGILYLVFVCVFVAVVCVWVYVVLAAKFGASHIQGMNSYQ